MGHSLENTAPLCELICATFYALKKTCVALNPVMFPPPVETERNKANPNLFHDKFAAESKVSNQFLSSHGFTNSMSVSLKNIMLTEVKQCCCEGTNDTSLVIVNKQQHLRRHIQGKMGLFF